jgi:hypothetical protein
MHKLINFGKISNCFLKSNAFFSKPYLIEEFNGNNKVQTPQVPLYKRDGFTVLEWGVVYQ